MDARIHLSSPHGIEPGVRKIAVLRANAVGDFLFSLPALAALRAAYPRAEIVLLAKRWHAEFLAGRPAPVDRVVVVPPARGVSEGPDFDDDTAALDAFFAAMAAERFDLAVQLHGGGRYSNPFIQRLGARLSIGLKAPDAAPLDRWVPYVYFHPEILRELEVVSLVGAMPVCLAPRIAVIERDRREAESVVPAAATPLAVLHPGATDPRRRWPVEKFVSVGDALARTGARVVVTGTHDENDLAAGVVRGMSYPALNASGRLSLGGLAGLLARCAVVVSNDSGPLHLAAAVGSTTAGIYWCYNLINFAPLTRSNHRPHVSFRLACPVCGVDCTRAACTHSASFVADVPAEEVITSALDLLSRRGDAQLPDGAPYDYLKEETALEEQHEYTYSQAVS